MIGYLGVKKLETSNKDTITLRTLYFALRNPAVLFPEMTRKDCR